MTNVTSITIENDAEVEGDLIDIDALITNLTAMQTSGATHVRIASLTSENAESTSILINSVTA